MELYLLNAIDSNRKTQVQCYPLSFAYMKSYAEKSGVPFKYEYRENLDVEALEKADVLALTCTTENYPLAKKYAANAKKLKPTIKVVVGGVHISMLPQSLDSSTDVGVLGEGEVTFTELIKNNFEDLSQVQGLVYWRNGKLTYNPGRPFIEPIDNIPHPDRSMYPRDRPPYLFTSRGCSYHCVFCSSRWFWRGLRMHSPEYVAEEIAQIKALYGLCEVVIYDDCFILDFERTKKITELVKPLGMTFRVSVRANLVSADVARTLKSMGVTQAEIGFESNSLAMLKTLQKENTPTDNQHAVDILKSVGIHVRGSFIHGIPGETNEDVSVTQKFIRRNNIDFSMYQLMPFPGTPLYRRPNHFDRINVPSPEK